MNWMSWDFFFKALVKDLPMDEPVDELRDFDDRFRIILRKHLAVLGWWAILNLITAAVLIFLVTPFWKYFLLMSVVWAIINFTIVIFIFDHIFYQKFRHGNTFQRFEVQRHVEKMLFLNIGLDSAYIFAGIALLNFAQTSSNYQELWSGFGWSVILQGCYLLLHDNFFHYLHIKNFRKARPFMESLIENQVAYQSAKKDRVQLH